MAKYFYGKITPTGQHGGKQYFTTGTGCFSVPIDKCRVTRQGLEHRLEAAVDDIEVISGKIEWNIEDPEGAEHVWMDESQNQHKPADDSENGESVAVTANTEDVPLYQKVEQNKSTDAAEVNHKEKTLLKVRKKLTVCILLLCVACLGLVVVACMYVEAIRRIDACERKSSNTLMQYELYLRQVRVDFDKKIKELQAPKADIVTLMNTSNKHQKTIEIMVRTNATLAKQIQNIKEEIGISENGMPDYSYYSIHQVKQDIPKIKDELLNLSLGKLSASDLSSIEMNIRNLQSAVSDLNSLKWDIQSLQSDVSTIKWQSSRPPF